MFDDCEIVSFRRKNVDCGTFVGNVDMLNSCLLLENVILCVINIKLIRRRLSVLNKFSNKACFLSIPLSLSLRVEVEWRYRRC